MVYYTVCLQMYVAEKKNQLPQLFLRKEVYTDVS